MNLFFSRNGSVALSIPRIYSKRFLASATKKETKNDDDLDLPSLEEQTLLIDNDTGLTEEEINVKRNKSRLTPGDRNFLYNKVPHGATLHRFHDTVKYKRRMFGRYGMENCDAPIGIAWPTKEQVLDTKEYESVLYPKSIHEMWNEIAIKNIQEAEAVRARDETIAKNFVKLSQWTEELNSKLAKKEAEAREARERKERLMEEVRRHFGFKISPKDERFKEMIAQKEKAEKKAKKAAKKLARDQKMIAMFAEKSLVLPKKEIDAGESKSNESA